MSEVLAVSDSLRVAMSIALCSGLCAQEPGFRYPETPAGQRSEAFLNAHNAGDEASYRALDELRSPASRKQAPFARLLPALQSVRAQVGQITPHSVLESTDTRLVLRVKLSVGDAWGRFELRCAAAEPHLIDSFTVVPAAPPTGEARAYDEWKELSDLLQLARSDGGFPALAAAVASAEGVSAEAAVGVRSRGKEARVSTSDRFHAGSITKAMTATLIGRLVERGDVEWDATLGRAFAPATMTQAFERVELRQLLRHRAGIPAHTDFDEAGLARLHALEGTPAQRRAAWVGEVLREEPIAVPGTSMNYSNAGYSVAAVVVERATDATWEQLLRDLVFRPLEIERVTFGWPPAEETHGHLGAGEPAPAEYALGPCLAPAGDVSLSAGDLARFGRSHLRGLQGESGALRAETIRELHRAGGDASPAPRYAAGWVVSKTEDGQEVHWHNGSAGTYYALLAIYPGQDLVVAVMMNIAKPSSEPIAWKVVEAIRARERPGGKGK